MYQWVNSQTGRTQMSSRPPAWYRSDRSGPRVFVFENGRLVDDTARSVSLEERTTLRAQALAISAEELAARSASKPDQAGTKQQDSVGRVSVLDKEFAAESGGAEGEKSEAPDETIARLKGIIDAWEKQQTAEAKRLLQENKIVDPQPDESKKPVSGTVDR